METFGFLFHPMDMDDVTKKYRLAKRVSPKVIAGLLKRKRPFVVSEINGIKSAAGVEAKGWFIAVPLLPHQFLELDREFVVSKVAKAAEIARKEGARVVGLGAFTALVGNGGRDIAERCKVPITTGNTYTVATAIEGLRKATGLMGIKQENACLAVVGATGSIGGACARVLAPEFGEVRLIGRDNDKLNELANTCSEQADKVVVSTNVSAIRNADVVITVTGAIDSIIQVEDIKPGAVVCDIARPRDVSELVARKRDDVLVIDGGIVEVPGSVNFNFSFGLPKRMALACMAETMILALEGKYESYTLGKSISVAKINEVNNWAKKHGFKLAGLRSFERALSQSKIDQIKANARKKNHILTKN